MVTFPSTTRRQADALIRLLCIPTHWLLNQCFVCPLQKAATELEVFLAGSNGFGDDGGRAVLQACRHHQTVHTIDLSANRMTAATAASLTSIAGSTGVLRSLDVSRMVRG